jgi:hypothetical protein
MDNFPNDDRDYYEFEKDGHDDFLGLGYFFCLVNSIEDIDVFNEDQYRIFGTRTDFKDKIQAIYPMMTWKSNRDAFVITRNGILTFMCGYNEIIENFVLVEVHLTEEPLVEIKRVCKKYQWALYDFNDGKRIIF